MRRNTNRLNPPRRQRETGFFDEPSGGAARRTANPMNSFPKIRALTLDVGGTLIRPWPSVGTVYARVAARHGLVVDPGMLHQHFAAAWRQAGEFHYSREEWARLVDFTFTACGEPPVGESLFAEIYDEFREPRVWQVFDDTRPALEALSAAGFSLGVISNWDDRLRPLLERLGLDNYFETLVISCEVGFTKPSPVIFAHAARMLGVPPGQILHVGDCATRDVAGARNAGFQAVHLARSGHDASPAGIPTLGELAGLLGH